MVNDLSNLFLVDDTIVPYDGPLQRNQIQALFRLNGKTDLISGLGIELMDEALGDYRVVASAAKHLAEVISLGTPELMDIGEDVTGKPSQRVLFSGNISIYKVNSDEDFEVRGYDYIRSGRIWIAVTPVNQYNFLGGLNRLVFGDSHLESDKVARLEWLLSEYSRRDVLTESSFLRRELDAYMGGRFDSHDGKTSFFGGKLGSW